MDSYYAVLDVPRTAEPNDIKKGFAKAALKWHPDVNDGNRAAAEAKFAEICEAYDVLSNPAHRVVYDQYGLRGLKEGIPGGNALGQRDPVPPYAFHGDCEAVFVEFFGGKSPFQAFNDYDDGPGAAGVFGTLARARDDTRPPPIERELACTLEELHRGCTKKVTILKRVLCEDGATEEVEKTLSILIKPGFSHGTRVTFPEEGDQAPGSVAADIVFVVVQQPHDRFERSGSNLIHTRRVPLVRALTGFVVNIETLDGRSLSIPINDIIAPGYTKVVPGEGMPRVGGAAGECGDLVLCFDVVFPARLNEQQKDIIKTAFGVNVEAAVRAKTKKRRQQAKAERVVMME